MQIVKLKYSKFKSTPFTIVPKDLETDAKSLLCRAEPRDHPTNRQTPGIRANQIREACSTVIRAPTRTRIRTWTSHVELVQGRHAKSARVAMRPKLAHVVTKSALPYFSWYLHSLTFLIIVALFACFSDCCHSDSIYLKFCHWYLRSHEHSELEPLVSPMLGSATPRILLKVLARCWLSALGSARPE